MVWHFQSSISVSMVSGEGETEEKRENEKEDLREMMRGCVKVRWQQR